MGERGISIESIAAWYAEAARNRRGQNRRRRGRHQPKNREETRSPEPQQRALLGLNPPGCLAIGAADDSAEVGHSGNTASMAELEGEGE